MGMRESLTKSLILKNSKKGGLQNTKLWYNRNIENKRSKQRGC